MSYCPKCGREIIDESLGCPICSVRDNTRPGLAEEQEIQHTVTEDTQKAEKVDTFTVEDNTGTNQKFENQSTQTNQGNQTNQTNQTNTSGMDGTWGKSVNTQYTEPNPVEEKFIPTWLKVLIIVMLIIITLFFSGFGAIAGLIAGIILMKSPVLDYQKFGKVLTITSAILVGIGFLCCLLLGGVMTFGLVNNI